MTHFRRTSNTVVRRRSSARKWLGRRTGETGSSDKDCCMRAERGIFPLYSLTRRCTVERRARQHCLTGVRHERSSSSGLPNLSQGNTRQKIPYCNHNQDHDCSNNVSTKYYTSYFIHSYVCDGPVHSLSIPGHNKLTKM